MRYKKLLKPIALLTVLFYSFQLAAPYQLFADHGSAWQAGGTNQGNATKSDNDEGGNKPSPYNNPTACYDPVLIHSGEYFYEYPYLSIPGRGMDIDFKHIYRSGNNFNNQFGFGWMFNYYYRLKQLRDGNVLMIDGERGRRDIFTYDGQDYQPPKGRFEALVQEIDGTWTLTQAHGRELSFDINGNLSAVTDRNGNQLTFTYDQAGYVPIMGVPQFTFTPGVVMVVSYDYQLTRISDTLGRAIDLTYDAYGRLTTITDAAGRNVTFAYDNQTNDLLTLTKSGSTEYPSGLTTTFTYDEKHNLETVINPKGETIVENTFDDDGRVIQQDYCRGVVNYDYGLSQTTLTDFNEVTTVFTYNEDGNVTERETFSEGLRPDDPASFLTEYTYNDDMLLTSVTYPEGNGVKIGYDSTNVDPRAHGNVLSMRRKENMARNDDNTDDIYYTLTYESNFNHIKSVTDPRSGVTTCAYDYELDPADPDYGTAGNIVMVTSPAVSGGTPKTDISYNNYGQVTRVDGPNGNVTQYSYYAATALLQSVTEDPSGINALTQLTYDSYGNIDNVTDPNNHTTDYNFDGLGWLTSVINSLGYATKYTHDQNGNVTLVERQKNTAATEWQTTGLTYDEYNKVKVITDPLSRVTTYNYDGNENLTSVVDAENNTITYQYDERNLLFKIMDANTPQGITQHDYDANGNLKKIIDADSKATQYTYDGFDRVLTKTYADTSSVQYAYDKNSNLTQLTPASNDPIVYVYDELNRLTNKNFVNNPSRNATYSYDTGGRLLTANNSASQLSFGYDALDRLVSSSQQLTPGTYTLSYSYDDAGNQTRAVYPSTKTLNYTYDAADQMDTIVSGLLTVDYTYDPLGRRTQRSFINNNLPVTDYTYDDANQLTQVMNTLINGSGVSQFDYTHDNVGNRLTMVSNDGTHNYSYNNIYELTGVTGAQAHSYAYDNVGNRTTADGVMYTDNTLNQYDTVNSVAFDYDLNGNLIDDGNNAYTWDEENKLLTAVNGAHSASYAYNAFNRRVSKTVDGVATYFVYDGDEVVAEYDGSGNLLAEYVYGDNIDEVLLMERGGSSYYYHHDGLGNVTEVTNAVGIVAESYTYDPYGNPSVTSSLIGNPYMFTGRRWDEETEIYYYRARMYSSSLGRFLQRDPIGILGGINLYGYVGNSPINYTDAYGLLNPNGQWPLYKKKDYEKGKKKLKEEMKKKYPWMSDKDLDKRADDIMREMTIPEAKRLDDFGKKGKEKEAEDLVKDICERTGANCDPQEPKEDEACEPQQ